MMIAVHYLMAQNFFHCIIIVQLCLYSQFTLCNLLFFRPDTSIQSSKMEEKQVCGFWHFLLIFFAAKSLSLHKTLTHII